MRDGFYNGLAVITTILKSLWRQYAKLAAELRATLVHSLTCHREPA